MPSKRDNVVDRFFEEIMSTPDIDYAARLALLEATSILKPAPRDTLFTDVLPAFRKWYCALQFGEDDGADFSERMVAALAATTCTISLLDTSESANAVRAALDGWEEGHGFRAYPWIREAATTTLFGCFQDPTRPRRWKLVPWTAVYQQMEPLKFPRKGEKSGEGYSDQDYIKQCDEAYARHRKAFASALRIRLGTRKSERVAAEWTALMLFGGESVSSIARKTNRAPSTISKAVSRFRARM